jgi:hypothetical protein
VGCADVYFESPWSLSLPPFCGNNVAKCCSKMAVVLGSSPSLARTYGLGFPLAFELRDPVLLSKLPEVVESVWSTRVCAVSVYVYGGATSRSWVISNLNIE